MNQGLTKAFKALPTYIAFASILYRIYYTPINVRKREFRATFIGKFSIPCDSVETKKVFNALLNVKL